MVNTNKILTVSYGTFSCTLEGFDESFDMMKSIAEYFRDLAADDRFFGAEPPTPDAEMLARIAEHQAARRVEARQERGSIVLRPTEAAPVQQAADQPPVTAQPAPAQAEAPAQQAAETPQPPVAEPAPQPSTEASALIEPPAPRAAAPVAPSPRFDEDSVAEKLSRIRAVVSRNTAQKEEPAAYIEDEHAEDLEPEAENTSDAMIDSILLETANTSQETEEQAAPAFDQEDAADAAHQNEDDALGIDDPQLAADVAEASDDDFEEEDDAPQAGPNARVIRMNRQDFEAAVADGQIEADQPEKQDTKGLSADDEEDLLRELAEVEQELNLTRLSDKLADDVLEADEDETEAFIAEPEPQAPPAAAPVVPAATAKEGETDVSRLMEKARQEMDRPEGAHRRSAIAHLRAAVEATRAETEAGGGLGRGDDSLGAYRDDLHSVVRPRRPLAGETSPEPGRRPVTKPAPLKLVAAQRVDTDETTERRVVRPRRVSLEDEAPQQTTGHDQAPAQFETFAEFAAQAGVKELSEVMEAAAAYMSYVEGRQKFSRPQLMNKARQLDEWQFSREDGLRSFGQLLRDGKIEKLKGGRFTVSDELISYKPDARAAG